MAVDAISPATRLTRDSLSNGKLTEPSKYTPLENVLFLQALRSQDLLSINFDLLSKQLVDLPILKSDASYDEARLTPAALQSLYTHLIHHELDHDIHDITASGASVSPTNPRKRKQPPQARPSIDELASNINLIPTLLLRFYNIFRESCIAEIKAEERHFDQASQEIAEIERGDWDEKLSRQIEDAKPRPATTTATATDTDTGAGTGTDIEQDGPEPHQTDQSAISSPADADTVPAETLPQPDAEDRMDIDTSVADLPSPETPKADSDVDTRAEAQSTDVPATISPPTDKSSPPRAASTRTTRKSSVQLPASSPQNPTDDVPLLPVPQQTEQPDVSPESSFQTLPSAPPHVDSTQPQPVFRSPFPLQPPAASDSQGITPISPLISTTGQPIMQPPDDDLVKSVLAGLRSRRNTWKPTDALPPIQPRSPKPPPTEPNSPTRSAVMPNLDLTQVQPGRSEEVPESAKPGARPKRRTRATRSASIISSTAQSVPKSRSQSVVSQAEEAQVGARSVKDEPTTPAPISEHGDAPIQSSPVTRPARSRRGTSTNHPTIEVVSRPDKESPIREVSEPPAPSPVKTSSRHASQQPIPGPRPDVIYCTRNLNRSSTVTLAQITAHRHGGQFQKPVSAKDIAGYKDIIKRPQDLKSIRAQIMAGSRAIAAALAARGSDETRASTPTNLTPAAAAAVHGPGGSGGSGVTNIVCLDKTPELTPPRAIVNSAQLEKEVLRVFANAVMFTPGNGGIVSDAREMSADVERILSSWRDVERHGVKGPLAGGAGREESVDETASGPGGAGERLGGGGGKRRKV